MRNKIKAAIVGVAIAAGTILPVTAAEAAPAQQASVSVHYVARDCGTFWSRAVALFFFHLLYPGCT